MQSLSSITKEDVRLRLEAGDWQEAIRTGGQTLLDRGWIEERYLDAMIQGVKEYGPYIVLAPGIALAHARPEDGALETGLFFTTLKQPTPFGHEDFDPVKLLIFLSAKDADSHVQLMGELATILCDEALIDRMISAKDEEEFAALIQEAVKNAGI